MSFLSAVRVALNALLVNKGRSMLTSLGSGISAVIAMVSAGNCRAPGVPYWGRS